LIEHGGRSHLPTGHAIDGVVYEDDGDIFTPVGGVKTFGNADGGKVSVTLIRKNDTIGKTAFNGCCHSRAPSMERFDHIHVKVIVSQYGASSRGNANRNASNTHLVNDFGDEPVDNTVTAAWTIVKNIFF